MSDDPIQLTSRLSIAAAGLSYVVVFLVAFQGGTALEAAAIKGAIAMLCAGVLGRVALAIADVDGAEASPANRAGHRLDVSLAAAPDEAARPSG